MSARAAGAGSRRRSRTRRVGTRVLVALAVGVAATFMVVMTARAVISSSSCTRRPTLVNVAVSNDIGPTIQSIAREFDKQDVLADGHCVQVQVTAGAAAVQASQIDGQVSMHGSPAIDAWIPDSSLWVDLARSYPVGAQVVQPTGKHVARSPLLLVTTKAVAARTHIFDSPPGWNVLLPSAFGGPSGSLGLTVDLPDPADSSAGLATLIEVSRQLGDSAAARNAFTKFVFNVDSTPDPDSPGALQTFVAETKPPGDRTAVTVASEQAVLAYDRSVPASHALEARYPIGINKALGTPELDYPYVLTTTAAPALRAAAAFGRYLQGSYAQASIRYAGFRSANGAPDELPASASLATQQLQLASAATPSEAASSLEVWQKLGLGSEVLNLIDVSPAMNQPSGNGTLTLEQELTQTAARGLAMFPDSTHMGLWEIGQYATAAKPYVPLVSMGPLPADIGLITRRQQLEQVDLTLRPSNGALALHDAILDAYQYMTQNYAADYSDAVVVLTSGVDNARGDISLSDLLARLRALYNPDRKVEIVIIMFGRAGQFVPLQQIAQATGGGAYKITNPAEVGRIFIEAIANRLCDQGCPAP